MVAELAFTLVLLVATGLFARSLHHLLSTELGFDTERVGAVDLMLPSGRSSPDESRAFYRRLLAEVATIPGVEASGLVSELPLDSYGVSGTVEIEGRDDTPETAPQAQKRIASPGYFAAMGIPVTAGRGLGSGDVLGAPPVVVVSERFAREAFDDGEALGRRIGFSWGIEGYQEIVGVVGDVKHHGLADEPAPAVYVPFEHRPARALTLVARSSLPLDSVFAVIADRVRALDPEVPVSRPRALAEVVSTTVDDRRLVIALVGAFAAIALVLAATGLYGLLSYTTRMRTREIGLRLALGASPRSALRRVAADGLRLVAAGLALGLLGAWAAGRWLASSLYGVEPGDPPTLLAVTALLAAVGAAASWLPAWRAVRVDPCVALRDE